MHRGGGISPPSMVGFNQEMPSNVEKIKKHS